MSARAVLLLILLMLVAVVEPPTRRSTPDLAASAGSATTSPVVSPVASPVSSGGVAESATAGSQSPDLPATIAAQATQLAQAATSVAAAQATAAANATQVAQTRAAGTTRINPRATDLSIQVDTSGLLAGDPAALTAARQELHQVLDPYRKRSCGVAVVLTFGHASSIANGNQLAGAINDQIAAEFPDLVKRAVFVTFADLDPPPGRVELRLYDFAGCPAAGPG